MSFTFRSEAISFDAVNSFLISSLAGKTDFFRRLCSLTLLRGDELPTEFLCFGRFILLPRSAGAHVVVSLKTFTGAQREEWRCSADDVLPLFAEHALFRDVDLAGRRRIPPSSGRSFGLSLS